MIARLLRFVLPALACVVFAAPALAAAVGTAFTYQGKLEKAGAAATGAHDFQFSLFDAATAGTQVGSTLTVTGVAVANGVFTVTLDFGAGAFAGQARWLQIAVKGSADAAYTTLTPRQSLAPAPYAMYALSSPGGGASQWAMLGDGQDLVHSTGGVGFTGRSSPFTGAGNGVFIEGGYPTGGYIFAFDYATNTTRPLILQSPGNVVGIGTTAPVAKLEVSGQGRFSNNGRLNDPLGYPAALYAIGHTGNPLANGTVSMGLYAASEGDRGVWGLSNSDLGVVGDNLNKGNSGWLGGITEGVYGQATALQSYGARFTHTVAGGVSLRVDGVAQVKTLQILGADLAERFPVRERDVEPGTVVMIAEGSDGALRVCDEAYSSRVAGVVSGANGLDAAVVLAGAEYDRADRATVAMSGRVWVKCDASSGAIRAGDLLTTSPRAGHAMRAADRERAYGAVLGKAMTSLETGTGLVLVLVNLQ